MAEQAFDVTKFFGGLGISGKGTATWLINFFLTVFSMATFVGIGHWLDRKVFSIVYNNFPIIKMYKSAMHGVTALFFAIWGYKWAEGGMAGFKKWLFDVLTLPPPMMPVQQ